MFASPFGYAPPPMGGITDWLSDVLHGSSSDGDDATVAGEEPNISGGEEFDGIALKITSQPPVVTLPGAAENYTENAPATILDATATVTDPDSTDFSGGSLTVDFSANGTASDRLAIFSGTQNDGDFVARLDGASCPASPGQDTRTVCFDAPTHNFAVLVFHVQVNLRVGIGPHKLRYGSFNGDSRLLVVC